MTGAGMMIWVLLLFATVPVSHGIGVDYGQVANNLPTPTEVVSLLKTTYITKVKIYSVDESILSAFANSGIQLIVGVSNNQISTLANSASIAQSWVATNIAAYLPATQIIGIAVGNEVLTVTPSLSSALVPAMQNIYTGLVNLGIQDKVKVSSPHSLGVLTRSYPPSVGQFRQDLSGPVFVPLLNFLAQTSSTFMVNAYPYFSFRDDPHVSIAYTLFQQNSGFVDPTTGLHYTNMFDAQVDAVYSALSKLGHQDVSVTVSETGWPSQGDASEVGVTVANAQAYNGNLLRHINAVSGTPLRPGVAIDTYIFSLFNENLKSGPGSERHFGLFLADGTPAYDVGLLKSGSSAPATPSPSNSSTPPPPTQSASPPPLSTPAPPTPAPVPSAPPPPENSTPPPTSAPPPPVAPQSPPPPEAPSTKPPPYKSPTPPPAPGTTLPPSSPPSEPPPPSHVTPPPTVGAQPSPPPHSNYTTPPISSAPPPPPPTMESPPPTPPPSSSPPPSVSPASPPPSPPSVSPAPPPPPPLSSSTPPSGPRTWCVAKPGASAPSLLNALNYACGEGGADCSPIQNGGSCYTPNTLFSHSSFAFNSYYSKNGRNYWNCYFGNSSLITITNPSYESCHYT